MRHGISFFILILCLTCSCQNKLEDESQDIYEQKVKLFYLHLLSNSNISESDFYELFGSDWKEVESFFKRENNEECFLSESKCFSYIFREVRQDYSSVILKDITTKQDVKKLLKDRLISPNRVEIRYEIESNIIFFFKTIHDQIYIEDVKLPNGKFIFENFEE